MNKKHSDSELKNGDLCSWKQNCDPQRDDEWNSSTLSVECEETPIAKVMMKNHFFMSCMVPLSQMLVVNWRQKLLSLIFEDDSNPDFYLKLQRNSRRLFSRIQNELQETWKYSTCYGWI
ncbi:hypothetical protein HNY73_012726 [Argiope bruennichi]|uniref:Uncharacterized protein n=1 Tax=Argiope bruennichi TaxID=94029 RepID=A0A8T0EXH6_ARGBR|nr:hypothetical protein HNY73_012726 [Argiope bruennichi]